MESNKKEEFKVKAIELFIRVNNNPFPNQDSLYGWLNELSGFFDFYSDLLPETHRKFPVSAVRNDINSLSGRGKREVETMSWRLKDEIKDGIWGMYYSVFGQVLPH